MATSTNIKINIVEPGSPTPTPTPVDPSATGTTDISVPDTGLFTHGIGAPEATIITVSVVLILAIAAIVSLHHKKKTNKKAETSTEVAHKSLLSKYTKFTTFGKYIKSNKKISIPLAALALVISLGTLAALLVNAGKGNTNAIEPTEGNEESTSSLTLDVESEELTIEVGDEPVFAVLPVELTVEEATQAGYALTAYTEDTNLVSTTDSSNIIPMVAADEGELVALADNTYGLSLSQLTSQDDEVYTVLSTDAGNPTFITDKDYEGTGENDKTTIYYGFYITPDTPYGTYKGSEIEYAIRENEATMVVFDGNGLYYDEEEAQIANKMKFLPGTVWETKYSHTPNLNDDGIQDGMYPLDSNETFVYQFTGAEAIHLDLSKTEGDAGCPRDENDYFSFWHGNEPTFTAKDNYDTGIMTFGNTTGKYVFGQYAREESISTDILGDAMTIAYTSSDSRSGSCGGESGYGYYAKITGYSESTILAGEYKIPTVTSYPEYQFLGWDTNPNAISARYTSLDEIINPVLLNMSDDQKITLYAIWSPIVNIFYDGNSATVGSMESTYNDETAVLNHQDVIAGDDINLYAPNYKKDGHAFAGWSTDRDAWNSMTDDDETNNPTVYGPNQSLILTKDMALAGEAGNVTLYAVWVPAEQNNGTPVALQDWQGCSNLTATTYDAETGTLNVGKNTITALTDSRDGNIYAVARLADGNCWMTENLRLDNEATISTTNTNNPVTIDGNVAIKNNDGNTSAHLSPNNNSWCNTSLCYGQSYLNTSNTNLGEEWVVASYNGNYESNKPFQWQSYGNIYNWYSATAGNGIYDKSSGEVAGDICPTGWSLPVGSSNNTSGSFYYLNQQMGGNTSTQGSNNWRSFPNNFVYSGYWSRSSASDRGNSGYYWSSTAASVDSAYYFYFHNNRVGNSYGGEKNFGRSVRCLVPAQ